MAPRELRYNFESNPQIRRPDNWPSVPVDLKEDIDLTSLPMDQWPSEAKSVLSRFEAVLNSNFEYYSTNSSTGKELVSQFGIGMNLLRQLFKLRTTWLVTRPKDRTEEKSFKLNRIINMPLVEPNKRETKQKKKKTPGEHKQYKEDQQAVINFLTGKNEPQTSKMISEGTGLSADTVHAVITGLSRRNIIKGSKRRTGALAYFEIKRGNQDSTEGKK
jgi:hypothetical protein